MLRNLSRSTCQVLSGCSLLAAMAFTVDAQPWTFTTFAGPSGGAGSTDGMGSAARFAFPPGVATDSGGNVYVADGANNTIRKITPAGVVTTLAGSATAPAGSADGIGGAARFHSPAGVATDSAGNIYVADGFNDTIRRISQAGVVTTLAGSATAPSGSADGTGSDARFRSPAGVTTDSAGNIYVADSGNNTIRKITPAGVVTTLAGSPGFIGSGDGTGSDARFKSPTGVATDSGLNIYVADSGNNTIRKITPAGVVTTLAGSPGLSGGADGTGSDARFNVPQGVATDSAGNVYVDDKVNNTMRRITPAGVVTTLAGSATADAGAADGIGSAARFNAPQAVATDSAGNVYVADTNNSTIRKITAGVVTTLAGSAPASGSADGTGGDARFLIPEGATIDSDGNVFVADTFNCTIRKFTPAGVVITFAGSAGFCGSQDGIGSNAWFNFPAGVAADSSGNVYVADTFNHTIRKITPAGSVTTLAGTTACGSADGTGSAARFCRPSGVSVDSDGSVYVADRLNSTIRKITPAGVVSTFAGSAGEDGGADGTGSAARFSGPKGLATDISGNVYVADFRTIRKITPAGVVTTLFSSPNPSGVTTDREGNLYVADTSDHTIRQITPAGVTTTVGGSAGLSGSVDGTGSAARFLNPWGVAVDRAGNVYVAESFNHRIRIGRPALADVATIDSPTGFVGTMRQLSTSPQSATSWQWRVIRQPSGSRNALSSTSIRNPFFFPDVADLYVFQLTASDGVKTSMTTVSLTATAAPPVNPGPRRRAVGHTP